MEGQNPDTTIILTHPKIQNNILPSNLSEAMELRIKQLLVALGARVRSQHTFSVRPKVVKSQFKPVTDRK